MSVEKTLYISDLDGTLLLPNERLSDHTKSTLNAMIDRGLLFSYATARSFVTASKVTAGLCAQFPVIVYNGAFIIDNKTGKILLSNYFAPDSVREIRDILEREGISPIIYAFVDGAEKFSSYDAKITEGARRFLSTRKGDRRENPVDSADELYAGEMFYFTCIAAQERLAPIYHLLKDKHTCIFHQDIYTDDHWLEILPKEATKASAALVLKAHLGCDKIVAFGDGKNDIPMFQIADESYALENAVVELKEISTQVIGANTEDGVVSWLAEHAQIS